MIITYHMVLFSDFLLDKNMQFNLGFSLLCSIGALVFINIALSVFDALLNLIRSMKLAKLKQSYEEMLKEAEAEMEKKKK